MRKIKLSIAVFSLFLLVPASITWAQTITTQKGLTTAEFRLSQGKIKVYLPGDIRPGDVISGTIIAEPFGNKPKAIAKNLADLNKMSVGIDIKRYVPMGTTPRIFTQTIDQSLPGIKLFSETGTLLHDIKPNGPVAVYYRPSGNSSANPYCIPSHSTTGSPFRIKQVLDGDMSNTRVTIGGRGATILTESPRSCIAIFPDGMSGQQQVKVSETGQTKCDARINGVKLDVSAPKTNLRKGESTTIHVAITGLEGLKDTASLTLSNNTPGIVVMQPSNDVVIFLLPDSVRSGTFNRQFNVRSIATGDFVVDVNLNLPDVADNPTVFYETETDGENKKDTVPCKEPEEALKKLQSSLQALKDELAGIDAAIDKAKRELEGCKAGVETAKAAAEAAAKDLKSKETRKDNIDRNPTRFSEEQKKKADADYNESKGKKEKADTELAAQKKKCDDLKEKIAGLEERKKALPGLIESLGTDIGKLKTELEKCKEEAAEKKRKADEERRKSEADAAAKTAAGKAEADARRETIETNRYLLQNIYSLGLISSKEFWETPGITSWLPEVLEKPIGDIAEEIGKSTIPADALPALAGVYQVVGMLLDPCTADGSRKTIERLKGMINPRADGEPKPKYTDEQAMDKTEKMCEMLKKIKALAAASGKK